MSATEFFSILGQALRFAQSPEALRGRAAFARGRAKRLMRKAEQARTGRKRRRIEKRVTWWSERAVLLDERARRCE